MLEYVSEMSEEKQGFIVNKYTDRSIYSCIYTPNNSKTSLTSDNAVITGLTVISSLPLSLTHVMDRHEICWLDAYLIILPKISPIFTLPE